MFENIIGHKDITTQLASEVLSRKLPGAILIEGAPYSGKLTTALELARGITCTGDRKWNCRCRSCRQQKLLSNPDTLLLGHANFMEEINFTAALLKRENEIFSRYMFLRSIRKLLHRFNPVFIDEKEAKFKKTEPFINEIEEKLENFDPESNGTVSEKFIDSLVNAAGSVSKENNLANISVEHVRKISFWAHTTSSESNKVVIFENCEKMNESTRNSLLKILEEPPEKCFFIFLTSKMGEIIPTIRSRLRVYSLKERSPEENRQVIERIFREKNTAFENLGDFFSAGNPDFARIDSAAELYVRYYFSADRDTADRDALAEELDFRESGNFRLFLERIIFHSRKLLLESHVTDTESRRLCSLNRFLNGCWYSHESLNISPELLLDRLLSFGEDEK